MKPMEEKLKRASEELQIFHTEGISGWQSSCRGWETRGLVLKLALKRKHRALLMERMCRRGPGPPKNLLVPRSGQAQAVRTRGNPEGITGTC